jgi:hypothetical protein
MAHRVTAREILRLRLWTQRILPSSPTAPAEVVRHLLAVQAQDFAQALWAVGVRAPGAGRSDVLAALDSGDIVRTMPMRGTLHFVPPVDLGWMLSLTSARSLQAASTRFRALGLDQPTLDKAERVARAALAGGRSLSREEFMTVLAENGIAPDGQRGYHIIFYLTQLRLVCWGPTGGTQQSLVLVDEWISRPRMLTRDEALREFALRYFTGHGPATVRDLAWWSKLTLADARAGIAAAGDALTELTLGETSYLIATSELDAAATSRAGNRVQALPGFDEYLLGYQDRALQLAAEHSQRIVPGSNGIFLPLIVAKGRVVGTWRRVARSQSGNVEPDYFAAASAADQKGFARAGRAYANFVLG